MGTLENSLKTKMERLNKGFSKEMKLANEKHGKELSLLKAELNDEKKLVLTLKEECTQSKERLSSQTRRYNTEERERQITFKRDLEAAERELSTALQTNIQLQEAYDELKSEKEKVTHKATRTITKTKTNTKTDTKTKPNLTNLKT